MTTFLIAFLIVAVSVIAAQRMAISRARSPRVWMWLAAFFGPLPLAVLAGLKR